MQSGLLPLEQAPRVTMGAALAFQMLPAALLIYGRPRWIADGRLLIASLLVIAMPIISEEVWLNAMHIQFHLTLAATLLLAFDPPRGPFGWATSAFILVLAPLCGPGALVLGPLFLARTVIERSPARLVQTGLLGLSGLVQLLAFFHASPVRMAGLSVDEIAAIVFMRTGLLPFLAPITIEDLGDWLLAANAAHSAGWWLFAAVSVGYIAWLATVAWRRKGDSMGWLVGAGLALALVAFGGGMLNIPRAGWFEATMGGRYNFLPLTLLGLAVVAVIGEQLRRGNRIPLYFGVVAFALALMHFPYPYIELRAGTPWAQEVARWRQDHDYQLRIWPLNWDVDLSDRTRPCPAVTPANLSVDAPSYCETHWTKRVMRDSRG